MVLLSNVMRAAAITGRPDLINTWFGGRQTGRWAQQTIRPASPAAARPAPAAAARAPADPAETLRTLGELHERGIITDAEFERLRARVRV